MRKPRRKPRLILQRIPAARPTSSRMVYDGIIPRPVAYRNQLKPPKVHPSKPVKGKVRRIPGVRAINITDPVGYGVYTASSVQDGGPGTTTSHSSGYVNVGVNTRTGITNPFWKDQTRLGSNATTPLLGTNYTADRSYWSAYSIGKSFLQSTNQLIRSWNYSASGFLQYTPDLTNVAPASVIADVHNRCIRDFMNEVIDAQSSENLTGRSIRHFKHDVHSTFHPMSGIQSKIQDYLTTLKKVPYGKLKGPNLYSTITQAYLEFKFGVQPFVNDITDIVKDMVVRDRKRNPSVTVNASAHSLYAGSSATPGSFGPDGGFMQGTFGLKLPRQITSVYSERLRGAVRTGINDDGRLGIIQDNRLLPKDWLPTAFSILPYAWMVNYFTNIRDIIDAASFRYSDLVWGCASSVDETICSFGDVIISQPNPEAGLSGRYQSFATSTQGGHAIVGVRRVTRFAISPATLMPSFAFSIPTTATPWVNMMAAFSPQIFKIVNKFFN